MTRGETEARIMINGGADWGIDVSRERTFVCNFMWAREKETQSKSGKQAGGLYFFIFNFSRQKKKYKIVGFFLFILIWQTMNIVSDVASLVT